MNVETIIVNEELLRQNIKWKGIAEATVRDCDVKAKSWIEASEFSLIQRLKKAFSCEHDNYTCELLLQRSLDEVDFKLLARQLLLEVKL